MQHSKILCVNCVHYKECSPQTRMYVNYCGVRTDALKAKINKALTECRAHQGLAFRHEAFIPLNSLKKTAQLHLSAV